MTPVQWEHAGRLQTQETRGPAHRYSNCQWDESHSRQKNIVHCDLQPENNLVKLMPGSGAPAEEHIEYINGVYKIADFGNAYNAGDPNARLEHGEEIGTTQ